MSRQWKYVVSWYNDSIRESSPITRKAYKASFVADILEIEGTSSAAATVNGRLNGNVLARLEVFHSLTNFKDSTRELVAKGHRDCFFRHRMRNFWCKGRSAKVLVEV
jgi:hypothetical protein